MDFVGVTVIRIRLVCTMLVALLTPGLLAAQSPAPGPAKPRIGHSARSPEVAPDGRVTFRFHAPNAQKVSAVREGAKRLPMTKDERGTWNAVTDPLPPDIYTYQFVVDGIILADPSNPLVKAVVNGGHESLVHVPGPQSLPWERRDVPHGVIHRHVLHSALYGEDREFRVYTPPGYDARDGKSYPVLYLLHGVMEDETAWVTAGRADVILDNLIADRRAVRMIVVMPLGYGFANVPERVAEQFGGPTAQRRFMEALTRHLLGELTPEVERCYHVSPGREARAIAGVSMGGAQALVIGLNHPDRFAWVGSFSGAIVMLAEPFATWFAEPAKAGPRPRLVWLSCGRDDFLLGFNRQFGRWLRGRRVAFVASEPAGAHAWPVWRRNLVEFATRLFRPPPV